MQPPRRDDQFYEFKNGNQERIYRLFKHLLGDGLAARYRDACILMDPKTRLDSSVHLVAHLFRELDGHLRSVLAEPGKLDKFRDQKAKSAAKEAARILKSAGVPDNDPLLKACSNFVGTVARTTHRDQISNILQQLGIPPNDPTAESWIALVTGDEGLHRYAHRSALGWNRAWNEDFKDIVEQWQEVFLFVLERFQKRYVTYHKRLDELLKKDTPSDEDVRQLRHKVPNNINAMTYFFYRNDKPGWLLRLSEEGFFAGPLEPEPEPETGERPYPFWPQGNYLIRMAQLRPADVMDILLVVKDRLNPYVLDQLIAAATKMPPEEAARIGRKVKDWLQLRRDHSFMSDCAELAEYLARGGCTDESLDLTRELLSVSPFADDSYRSSQLVWNYDYVIKKIGTTLVDVAGLQGLSLFCNLLDQALDLSWGDADQKNGHDNSCTWRPRIESTPDRGYLELEDAFVTAVRDSSVRLVRNDPGLLSRVVEELEGRRWLVFHRLALHLLCEFPNESLELAIQRLKEFRRYDYPHFFNEYYRLARTAFPLLDPVDQSDILDRIQAGPDVREVRRWLEKSGKEITDETVQQKIRYWVRNYLSELRPLLDESRTSFLKELERELGDAEPLVRSYRNRVAWSSSESHKAPEFGSMAVQDIVSFLESVGPLKGSSDRCPDDVWHALLRAVKGNPEKFCQQASDFRRIDPTYVNHLFRGLREALREDRFFTWKPLLMLAEWVVNQGREIPGRSVNTLDWDADWGDTRREIVDLVHTGLEARTGGIPYELRDLIWRVLHPLTLDLEPTVQYERQMIRRRQDPLQLAGGGQFLDSHMHPRSVAINTVRCLALRTVFQYARWVKHNLFDTAGNDELPIPGFAQMPEVREVLDYHVDSRNDGSIAIGFVYGAEFPLICWLDRTWAEANTDRIFSRAGDQRGRGAAAWEGYLFNWSVEHYDELFDVLKREYEQAVAELGTPARERGHFINPDLRLGEHLRNLYLVGKIRLDSPEAIWVQFFAKADDETLGALISGIGWEMCTQKEFSKLWLEQFQTLWEWRIDRIGSAKNPTSHRKELRAFGSWFASGKFDDAWALARLLEALEIDDKTERDYEVVTRLANLVERFPKRVLECVTRMVKGVPRTGTLHYWNEDLQKIVSITGSADDQVVRQKCSELKNILVSNGMNEYA